MFWCVLLIYFILFQVNSKPQLYKSWFLNQTSVECFANSVGYAQSSYYKDTSAINAAFLDACENYVRNKQDSISGGGAFWATEGGTFAMGNNLKEIYDTLSVKNFLRKFKILDTFIKNDFVAVLAGENYCTENSNELKEMIPISFNEPEWVQIPPKSDEYYYAVGIAPGYYYEKSSWQEAEKSARFQLASTISVYVESLQLMDPISGQDIKNQEISVILKNISIVSRWIDNKNNFFYVLMRIPKDER